MNRAARPRATHAKGSLGTRQPTRPGIHALADELHHDVHLLLVQLQLGHNVIHPLALFQA